MSGYEDRALLELNQSRETWCQVEMNPRQGWERSQRRHYRSHLKSSSVLLTALTGGPQRREACTQRPAPIKLPERRHFEEGCKKASLKILEKCFCRSDMDTRNCVCPKYFKDINI